MTDRETSGASGALAQLHGRLVQWLRQDAYPLWARYGVDARNGGFFEALAQNGRGLPVERRARVQPRQIYAFALAPRFGWRGDASGIIRRGLEYFTTHYRRADGLFRTLADAEGRALDESALLYDQAFALLGYAGAASALTAPAAFEGRAVELRRAIERRLGAGDGAYLSVEGELGRRDSNPHMHLLEACLVWMEVGEDPGWRCWGCDLAQLALQRFIDAKIGAVRESFAPSWEPLPGIAGRIIEPGHQYEWAGLLLRTPAPAPRLRAAALQLMTLGERGVRNGVVVNALLDDFSVHDATARLWPQTERLKAALLFARLTGEARFWSMAQEAATSLLPYLSRPVPGLWYDLQLPDGRVLDSPAPASTFYHLVSAIAILGESIAGAQASEHARASRPDSKDAPSSCG